MRFARYFTTHHRNISPCPRSWSPSVLPTTSPAASTYLFVAFQTNGMIRQAKTRFIQAGGKLDDEEAWEDIDYILDSDDEEETQGESQV